MKKFYLTIFLLLGTLSLVQAQAILVGDRFYDGFAIYTVREIRPGNIIYMTDVLGDEELTLEQWGDNPGVYRLRPSRNAEEPKYGAEFGCRVNYVSQPNNQYLEVIGDNDMVLKVLPLVRPMDGIKAGSLWYSGSLVYDANPDEDGSVRMTAMAEGEEHAFLITPAMGGTDLFEVSDSPNGEINSYDYAAYARRIRQDGLDVICFYDRQNRLTDVMQATQDQDAQTLNVKQWMALLCGNYKTEGGAAFEIADTWFAYKGYDYPLEPVTFNGMVTGVLDFGDTEPFVGRLEAVPTRDGLLLTEVKMEDGEPWFERTVSSYALKWAGNQSRFAFASDILLNGVLHRYDKSLLRVMRNAILASHGYVFRSKDLKSYFEAQPWYHPAANNANIQLSLLEQLNIALIQAAERAE
jgi:hypothetical protein